MAGIMGVVTAVVVMVVIGGSIYICCCRKRRRAVASPPPPDDLHAGPTLYGQPPSPGMVLESSPTTFTIEELERATDHFLDDNFLGKGGFGDVYRGVLPDGKLVAVKKLKPGSRQGKHEFRAEVEIISRVHHRHLVSLVGYCITGDQRMLVYEFVPNKTLKFHLHGEGRPTMDWSTRMKIAVGSAKGLAYLHEGCNPIIIHWDIKATNILLNCSFEVKFIDLDYFFTRKLKVRSDVFSFGVVLLELITGHQPGDSSDHTSLVDWARLWLPRSVENVNLTALVDPKLVVYNPKEMIQMIYCAAACVSASHRPRMSEIVRALELNMSLDDLVVGFISGHSTVESSYATAGSSLSQDKEDLKEFKQTALESQELGSSEQSAPPSEYGQHRLSPSTDGIQSTQEMENQNAEKNIRDSH